MPPTTLGDDDWVYMRVHRTQWKANGEVTSGAFQPHGDAPDIAMSTEWAAYATAEETRARSQQNKPAEEYGVVRLQVGYLRNELGLEVTHTPLPENFAHVDVKGTNPVKIRRLLAKKCEIVIKLEDPV